MTDAYAPFDLTDGPIWRARLYAREDEHVLLLAFHHIAVDLWSLVVLPGRAGGAVRWDRGRRRTAGRSRRGRTGAPGRPAWRSPRALLARTGHRCARWPGSAHRSSPPTGADVSRGLVANRAHAGAVCRRPRPRAPSFIPRRMSFCWRRSRSGSPVTPARRNCRSAAAETASAAARRKTIARSAVLREPGAHARAAARRGSHGAAGCSRPCARPSAARAHQDLPFPLLVEKLQIARDPSRFAALSDHVRPGAATPARPASAGRRRSGS